MKKLLLIVLLSLMFGGARAQNLQGTILPAIVRTTTATINSPDQTNLRWSGGHFVLNMASYTTGVFTPTIQGKDPITGVYYTILAGPAIATTGVTIMRVYPGLVSATNTVANDIIPMTWRVSVAVASPTTNTFSFGFLFNQ